MKATYNTAYSIEGILNDLSVVIRYEPNQQVKERLNAITDKLTSVWDSLEVDPNE